MHALWLNIYFEDYMYKELLFSIWRTLRYIPHYEIHKIKSNNLFNWFDNWTTHLLITFFIKYLHHVTWNNDKLTWVDSQLHIQHSSIKQNLPLWYNLLLTKRVAIYTFRVINGLSIGSWKGKIDLWGNMFHSNGYIDEFVLG